MAKHLYLIIKLVNVLILILMISLLTSSAQSNTGAEKLKESGRQVYTWQNPFIQPLQISDYYGSGDVNVDGLIDMADHQMLIQIINNQHPKNIRCDIDGNGIINNTDANILLNSIQNSVPLPSSWNYLQNSAERIEWIENMLSIDKIDENIYEFYYYQCLNYAHELYFQFSHYLSDVYYNPIFPLNTVYNGGQSIYNLPVYFATVMWPGTGHAINCILIGDDPLNFYDWRFFEPSDDFTVFPGMWNMPYGSTVSIDAINTPSAEVNTFHTLVTFTVSESGVVTTGHDQELVLERPVPTSLPPENKTYQWYPNLLVDDTVYVLYDQMRDDLSRRTDIFIKNTETGESLPVTMMDETSVLLDYVPEEDGNIHLLFSSRQTRKPGVYYGLYNINTREFSDLHRISDQESRVVPSGKLIIKGEEVFAFWFLSPIYMDMSAPGGIYYNHLNNGVWSTENLIYPIDFAAFSLSYMTQSIFPYLMEGSLLSNGDILLVTQSINDTSAEYSDIVFIKFDGNNWDLDSLQSPISNSSVIRGMDLIYDGSSRLDLVFTNPWCWPANTDPAICHTFSNDNGVTWQDITFIDTHPIVSCNNIFSAPRLIKAGESLFLTYINKVEPSKIIWRKYENNQWQFKNYIELQEGNYAWFPQIAMLPSDELLFAWSNSSEGRIDLKTQKINCSLDAPSIPSGPDSIPEYAPTEYITNSVDDATYYEWVLTPSNAGYTDGNDTTVTIIWEEGFTGEAFLKVRAINGCSEGSFSEELPINVTVGVKMLKNNLNGISIYPNPVNDLLYVDYTGNGEPIDYQITSIVGKKMKSGKLVDNLIISTVTLPDGIYILNLRNSQGTFNCKFEVSN